MPGGCPSFNLKDVSFIITVYQEPCLTFSGVSTNCTSCGTAANGSQLYLFSNTCTTSCSVNYFNDGVNPTCDFCHLYCLTCFGTTASSCSTCDNSAGYYISSTSNSTCVSCSAGIVDNLTCYLCQGNCATCSVIATNCTSCSIGSTAEILYNNTCISSCPDYYRLNGGLC